MAKREVGRDAGTGEFVSKDEVAADPDGTVLELIEFDDPDDEAEAPEMPEPSFHTILKVWKEVLSNAEPESHKNPSPQWCQNIITSYVGLTFADCLDVRDLYFELLQKQYEHILAIVKDDPDSLTYTTAEEDLEENGKHYRELIFAWSENFLRYEMEWDCQDPQAAARIAALSEVHKMYLGANGLTQHLDNIRFEFTDEDQLALRETLDEVLAERGGDSE